MGEEHEQVNKFEARPMVSIASVFRFKLIYTGFVKNINLPPEFVCGI